MLGQILQPEIQDLIAARNFVSLKEVIMDLTAPEVADIFLELPVDTQAIIFRLLPRDFATDVFEYLDVDGQQEILKAFNNEEVASILNDMSPDDRTALLEELPGPAAHKLIMLLSPQERLIANRLLGYPENSIGRLMTPDYIAVHEEWTVNEVLEHIRKVGKDKETLNIVYVVDQRGALIDDISIRQILLSPQSLPIAELMDGNYEMLKVTDDQEVAVDMFKQTDRTALPVVDGRGALIGIVTVDDILDVAEEEATEDIQKLGGMEALDEPYDTINLSAMVKKRAGWLSFLFIGEMFTASAMAVFEHEIQKAVILALFVPLIISSGGNSGSQAATLITRALALGEITLFEWFKVLKRELITGLILGGILAVLGFARISFWQLASGVYGEHWMYVGFTVAISLIGVVLWGTIIGAMLPLVMKRLGFDPATSSAPFVATLVDVTGLIIYFSVGMVILKGKLL